MILISGGGGAPPFLFSVPSVRVVVVLVPVVVGEGRRLVREAASGFSGCPVYTLTRWNAKRWVKRRGGPSAPVSRTSYTSVMRTSVSPSQFQYAVPSSTTA